MWLHYSEKQEAIRKLAKLGKAAWRSPACKGRRAQNVEAGVDLQWNVAKEATTWTSPDFARYRECLMADINGQDKQVTVCRTIKQDVEFIKVVYQEAEAQVVTSNSLRPSSAAGQASSGVGLPTTHLPSRNACCTIS